MAGKYHYISALAEMTAADIVKNENEWTRFLTTAARLYKYPFNEQMLIYAQRPDVTDLLSFVSLAFLCNPADFLPDYLFHLQCYI